MSKRCPKKDPGCFYTLSHPFICFRLEGFTCFHMLLYAFIRFYILSNIFIYTFISFYMLLHALWYIRVSDAIPVLKNKGILSIFEYSRPLHPPLTPFIHYWGTLMRDRFPVLNTLPKLKYLPSKKPCNGDF